MKRVLIVTNSGDVHSDNLVKACARQGVGCFRYNTDHARTRGTLASLSSGPTTIAIDSHVVDLADVDLLIYRRPIEVTDDMLENRIEPWMLSYLNQEWSFAERAFAQFVRGKVMNMPSASLTAQNKWVQLRVARDCGLAVPPTLVSNNPHLLRDYLKRGACVTKAIGNGSHLHAGIIHTGTTIRACSNHFADEYQPFTLSLLQVEIPPAAMWRVVTIGNRCIAFRMSGAALGDDVDSRLVEERLRGTVEALPDETQASLQDMMSKLGILYASSDFIEDRDGRLWFIDLNPDGQWGAYELRFDVPISDMIVEEAF